MARVHYREIEGRSRGFYLLLTILGIFIAAGLGAAWSMEHQGHHITGMTNRIVWGVPHVFAVFLIVAASGALNVASIASVFGRSLYKPLARLSGLLAVALLAGGLAVLVLDLGRPERLIVAMTHYNFKSIFAWNIFLYTGFFAIVALYLWTMFERRMNGHSARAGLAAFLWRLVLTTGTGSIFGFLVAREPLHSALLAPLFIVMSFSFGLAIFVLVLMAACSWTGRSLGEVVLNRLRTLLGVFVATVLYFVAVHHLTNLYIARQHDVERFFLWDGGIYPWIFWLGQILVGGVLPLALLFGARSRSAVAAAAVAVIAGGFAQVYVLIIGGQAYPQQLFPGKEVSSSFFDGVAASYAPSLPELALGVGGVALAAALTVVGLKVLPFLPAKA
ncbi:MAG TPA: NrfD/PsrC family molybdoenzyme membrane anchor subunit [Burkholderiales bacterium]|jgi:molybdopterin-containing oxidoreductase family membrane subunit|nr:NrfD/PsrC family molybdoenzyme membrane anchor subunit [Burkholderiales bacterium]